MLKKSQLDLQIEKIVDSSIFDKEYYEEQVGKKFSKIEAAISDYLKNWSSDNVKASRIFDQCFYLEKYTDVKDSGVNPLLHYIEFGAAENRNPNALFFPSYLISQLSVKQRQSVTNPLTFYVENPYAANPCALFNGQYYAQNNDIGEEHPLNHYLKNDTGNPHPLFIEQYIRGRNEIPEGMPVLLWYMNLENKNGVQCCPLFDNEFYLQVHPELYQSDFDALSHYIAVGSGNHSWPSKLFWAQHYEKQVGQSILDKYDTALSHFIMEGCSQGLTPNPWFDPAFYLNSYQWVADDERTALGHYLEDGWKDDFMPSENFSPKYVRQHYGIDRQDNPLAVYLLNHAGKPTLPEKAWFDPVTESEQRNVVKKLLTNAQASTPRVSVVVPVYNNFSYTLRCVYSMLIAEDKTPFEIIIADDQSSDETEAFFFPLEGLSYIRNPTNLGFLLSCNNAAKSAKGEFVFFLNNDTAVLDGWLDRLIETFENEPNVGLVGSKLLYPNGLLQEAGGILWRDGAANYGKFDDPDRPEYSYLRDVDYVSGAAIMVPNNLWKQLGGFDERYVPAYCEDSDFCLQVRHQGLRVMMQSASKVVHFEGISNGTDLNSGIKKYQVGNSQKLSDKWQDLLKDNGQSGDFNRNCVDRNTGPRLLIIDATIPTPDQDAGSVTVWYFLKIFRQLGYQITFLPENLLYVAPYTENVQALGVECVYAPYETSVNNYIEQHGNEYDVVMLYRAPAGGRFYEQVRKFAPQAKIIFDTVDLHFLREERQAKMEKNKDKAAQMLAQAAETKARELYLIKHSDNSIVLSEYEKQMLKRDYGIRNTFVVPIVLDVPGSAKSFNERKDIAFIGGYQHTPNIDAVLYFVEKIWPQVKEKIPGIKFYVVGSKPPAEILELSEDDTDIIVTGFVEDLDPIFADIRLTVAPLRFGAGIKGKIGTSLSYGVPCIATKVASEGMGLEHGKNILMSDEDSEFVNNIVSTYENDEVWDVLSKNGLDFIAKNYSVKSISQRIRALFNSIGAPYDL